MRNFWNSFTLIIGLSIFGAPALGQIIADYRHESIAEREQEFAVAYLKAEQALLIDERPNETLSILATLRGKELPAHERKAVMGLTAAAHLKLGNKRSAAIALEDSLRALPLSPNEKTLRGIAVAIDLYSSEAAYSDANRLRRLWESMGGNPLDLADKVDQFSKGQYFNLEPIDIGGEPNPLDLVLGLPKQPLTPEGYEGTENEPTCNVLLSVDVYGAPYDIKPRCESYSLGESAVEFVASLKFSSKIVRGERVPRIDIVYPVTFSANGNQSASDDATQ